MLKGKDIKAPARTPSLLVVLTAGSLIVALALGARSTMGIFLDPVVTVWAWEQGLLPLWLLFRTSYGELDNPLPVL